MRFLPAIVLFLLSLSGFAQVEQAADPPEEGLPSTFFHREAEFPNYFLPEQYRQKPRTHIPDSVLEESRDRLTRAVHSLFRRMTLTVAEDGKIVQKRYFQEIQRIAASLDPAARAMPSGGVVRSVLGYLYQRVYDGVERGVDPEDTLKGIIEAEGDIDSLNIRGIGSDMDVLVDSPGGKSAQTQEAIAKITDSIRVLKRIPLEGVEPLEAILFPMPDDIGRPTLPKAINNTLFPIPDVHDYHTFLEEEYVLYGGSHLDFLAFDMRRGDFVEPSRYRNIVDRFLMGVFDYTAAVDNFTVKNPAKQTFRGIRVLLEIPFLRVDDEAVLRRELDGVLQDLKRGEVPNKFALSQFVKMTRNARFSGAHNRFFRGSGGSIEELIKDVITEIERRVPQDGRSGLVAEFIDSIPLETRASTQRMRTLDGGEPLVRPEEFIRNYTDGGILYHGTPFLEDGLSVVRGGLVTSRGSRNQNNNIFGPGAYLSRDRSEANAYAGETGVVFELRVKNSPSLRIVDVKRIERSPEWSKILQSYGYNRDPSKALDQFVADYGIDILVSSNNPTISLVQNTRAMEMPTGAVALINILNRYLTNTEIDLDKRLTSLPTYKIMYDGASPSTRIRVDEPIRVAENMVDRIQGSKLDVDTLRTFIITFPPKNDANSTLYEKLLLKLNATADDPNIHIRTNVLLGYQHLSSTGGFSNEFTDELSEALVKSRRFVEEAIANPNIPVLDRLNTAETSKPIFSVLEDEFFKIVAHLREGMVALMTDSNLEIDYLIHCANRYKSIASSEDFSKIADKLGDRIKTMITDTAIPMDTRLLTAQNYRAFVSSQTFLKFADKLHKEVEKTILDANVPIRNRLSTLWFYGQDAPRDDVVTLAAKLRRPMEAMVVDPNIPISDRISIAEVYKRYASPEDFSEVANPLRKEMEAALMDTGIPIDDRIFIAERYKTWASRDDLHKTTESLVPTPKQMIPLSSPEEGTGVCKPKLEELLNEAI